MKKRLIDWLICCEVIDSSEIELYEYAIDCSIMNFVPLVSAIIIGGIFKNFLGGLLIVLPFMIVRKYSGVVHAKTRTRCFIYSGLIIAFANIMAIKIQNDLFCSFLLCLSTISLVLLSPVENEKKKLETFEKKVYKKRTIVWIMFFVLAYILFLINEYTRLAICISIGVIICSIMQMVCIISKLIKG